MSAPTLRSGTQPGSRSGTQPASRSGTQPASRSGTQPGRTRSPRARSKPSGPPRRPVDPRVRDRWVAARREEGRRRLRILIAIASVITVLALAWGATVSPLLAVEQIDVKGNAQVPAADVIAAAQVGEGDAMVWLDPGEVVARLEASPWIRTAKVTRDWPRTLVIRVTERTPAAWVQVDGQAGVLVVDRAGRVLTRADAPPAGLPQIVDAQGAEPGGSIVPARGAAVAAAYGSYASAVAQISVTDGGAVVKLVSGPEVRLGPPTQLRTKLRAAGAVLDSLPGAVPAYVDVSVPTNPVAG
jgi:cell division protein FtsQ